MYILQRPLRGRVAAKDTRSREWHLEWGVVRGNERHTSNSKDGSCKTQAKKDFLNWLLSPYLLDKLMARCCLNNCINYKMVHISSKKMPIKKIGIILLNKVAYISMVTPRWYKDGVTMIREHIHQQVRNRALKLHRKGFL